MNRHYYDNIWKKSNQFVEHGKNLSNFILELVRSFGEIIWISFEWVGSSFK